MNREQSSRPSGLKLVRMASTWQPLEPCTTETVSTLLSENFTGRSAAVLWLDDRVETCLYRQGTFTFFQDEPFTLRHVQRMRVFNADREFHLVRGSGNSWQGRLRIDGQGEEWDMVIACQLLFGTRKGNAKPESPLFTSITEDRGATLHLPLKGLEFDEKGNLTNRVFIKTHNYIQPNQVHQAGYVDCRFVEFCAFNGENNNFIPLELAGEPGGA